jgi:hypothetical protein
MIGARKTSSEAYQQAMSASADFRQWIEESRAKSLVPPPAPEDNYAWPDPEENVDRLEE